MFPSIFSDELGLDITEAAPIIRSWGLQHLDLRGRVFGKAAEALPQERLPELKKLLADHGLAVGCLQSSLAKVHLPDEERCRAEEDKLEGILRAAEALDCRRVRVFHYWQPENDLKGELAVRPDLLQEVLDRFEPLAERAKSEGLLLGFENCGVTVDEAFTVLDALNVPQWGLAWDVWNSWDDPQRKKDEQGFLLKVVKRTRMVHVKAKGAVAGLADDTIPYDKVLQLCDQAGVEGPVSAETHNPDKSVSNQEMSQKVVEVIQKAWPSAAPGALEGASAEAPKVTRPWEDDPVRFAVIGLGMGHNRSRLICSTPGTKLMGVCDLTEERAKRTGEECGVPYNTEMKRWLEDDNVEVIYVMTETGKHAEVALQALEAGKHVITTKPMEASLTACEEMIQKAKEKERILAVDFEFRFHDEAHAMKRCVEEGWFGRLLSGDASLKVRRTMEYFQSNGGWRGTRRWDGGGVLSNQSIHLIDELAFTLGIPQKVRCDIWTQDHDIEAEDLGSAVWLYENGLVITYTATTCFPQKTWYVSYELAGIEGAFHRTSGGPREAQTLWFKDGAWGDVSPLTAKSPWLNAADNFAACLRAGEELVCSGEGGRATQSILDAMYRSAYDNAGGWTDVAKR